ncbi:uncharacterized protein LOC113132866 [Mastacembelus armatus]|uniref:uncharacterized protein LOC113132866 n=1 Tax=Mastacembelus armatus TaxID=205130 RepID=UPI000E460BBD|nr:uncharacterized protein LOC113132866 [Mastacembelus armatus]
MEQDFIAGLYHSMCMSIGPEFSSEDVSLLYRKIFHAPANTTDANTAMKKISGDDNNCSCVGENVLDVLLEMEREREKKERIYWDLELLSVGNLNTLYVMDKPVIVEPREMSCLHQSTSLNTFKKAFNQSDSESLQSCTIGRDSLQMGKTELCESVRAVKRLKKERRQCWARPRVDNPCRAEQAALWLQDEEEELNKHLITPQQQSVLQLLVLTQEQERKHLVKLDQISSKLAKWSQQQLENCALLLLTHLLELQEVQASALLPVMMDTNLQYLQVLREEYESELQAPCYSNLLQLLTSDALTSGSTPNPCSNFTEKDNNEQTTTQSCCTGPVEVQNSSDGQAETLTADSLRVQAADGTKKQDVCTGCGAVMEELPYLEILCVSDATNDIYSDLAPERGTPEEDGGSTPKNPDNDEKQGSLITLAWSKPSDSHTDYDAESANGGTGQTHDMNNQVQPSDMSCTVENTQYCNTSGESHDEKLNSTLIQSGSTGHHDGQSVDQCSTKGQVCV